LFYYVILHKMQNFSAPLDTYMTKHNTPRTHQLFAGYPALKYTLQTFVTNVFEAAQNH